MTETRVCTRCKRVLPLTREFFSPAGSQAGIPAFRYSCRPCRRKAERPREHKRPEPALVPAPPLRQCPGRRLPRVPSAPIIAKLMERVAMRNGLASFGGQAGEGGMGSLCAQLGIPERTVLAWRLGERDSVKFDVADRVLTRAGWLWWDVFNEETVLLPDGTTDWETLRRVEHDWTCEGCEECEKKAEKHAREQELKVLRGEVAA